MSPEFDLPPERDLPPGREAQRREHLVRELRADVDRRRGRLPRRGLLLAPLAALTVAGGAWATGVLDGGESVTEPEQIICHAAASLKAPSAQVGLVEDDVSPRAQCGLFYERGVLAEEGAAPELASCVDDGRVRVFPGKRDVCAKLDLEPLSDSGYLAQVARIQRIFKVLDRVLLVAQGARNIKFDRDERDVSYTGGDECARAAEVRRLVRPVFARENVDWRVDLADGATDRGCVQEIRRSYPRWDGRSVVLDTDESQRARTQEESIPLPSEEQRCASLQGPIVFGLECPQDDVHLATEGCTRPSEVRRTVRAILDGRGLSDWDIEFRDAPKGDPEASIDGIAADTRTRLVTIRFQTDPDEIDC